MSERIPPPATLILISGKDTNGPADRMQYMSITDRRDLVSVRADME